MAFHPDMDLVGIVISIWGFFISCAIFYSADKITKAIEQLGKDKP